MKTIRFIQITTKSGLHYQIGDKNRDDYNKMKKKIKRNFKQFVKIIDGLEIRKSEILSIEYFEKMEEENEIC